MSKEKGSARDYGKLFYIGELNEEWLNKKMKEAEEKNLSATLRRILKKLREEEEETGVSFFKRK